MLKINLIRKTLLILCSCSIFLAGCNGEPSNGNPSTGNGDDTSSLIKFGSSAGSSFAEGQLAASLTEGTSSWTVSATVVDQNNSPVNTDYEVSFLSSCVTAGLSSFSSETASTVAGRVSVIYSSESCEGVDVITATLLSEGSTLTASVDIDIDSATGDSSGGNNSIKLGSSAGGSFTEGQLTATLNNAGTSAWTINSTVVDQNNNPVNTAHEVSFSSSCATDGLSSFSSDVVTTVAGRASTQYSSESCTGVDVITATVASGAMTLTANVDIDIDTAGEDNGQTGVPQLGSFSEAGFISGELRATLTSLSAGGSTTITAAIVDANETLITTPIVFSFSSPCTANTLSRIENADPQDTTPNTVETTTGSATITYIANGCSGTDRVTARVSTDGFAVSGFVDLTIAPDQVIGLNFISAEPSQLALSGTGGTETSTVTFKLVGAQGGAIVGETVRFELSSTIGGISLSEESAVSDTSGLVSTIVQSGTVSTSINIRATHDLTGTTSFSNGIVISSGVPVDSKLSLSLSSYVPPDAFDTDGIELDVNVIASDYFGNNAVNGSQVFFASPESGNIGGSCTLQEGACSVVWRSAGSRPSDLRAGIIAYTAGAENYTDNNGNNVYDGADTFSTANDLGEPYVDENENGIYDVGEFFVDESNDGVRDEGNGFWDGPCLASVNAAADCSGNDSVFIYKTAVIRMPTNAPRVISSEVSYDSGNTWTDIPVGGTINTSTGTTAVAMLRIVIGDSNSSADIFGNHPLPEGTVISSSIASAAGGSLSGDTTIEVLGENHTSPNIVTLSAQDTNLGTEDSTTLNVRASSPGKFSTTFAWNVDFDSP